MLASPGLSYHPPTFAGFPRGSLDDVRPGMVVVAGFTVDSVDSRPGAAAGPAAVRAAAARFIARIAASPSRSATDPATGRTLRVPLGDSNAIDIGDVDAAGWDSVNVGYRAEQIYKPVLDAGGIPLVLGGEHVISIVGTPVLGDEFGFLHVGRSLTGSEGSDSTDIEVAFGVTGQLPVRWLDGVSRATTLVITSTDIGRDGIDAALRRTQEHLAQRPGVVVGIDMGIVDAGYAAGAPEIGIGGLTPRDLLALAREVGSSLPVRMVIIDGVAPGLDGRRRTESLAARVAIELIAPKVFA